MLAAFGFGAAGALWRQRERVANALTSSQARRPSGRLARALYGGARAHQDGFRDTLHALALEREDRLVEIGCGGGIFLELALRRCGFAKAVDHSPEMVRLTSERNAQAIRNGRLDVLQGCAERLPFGDLEFTAAAMTDVLLVLDDPDAVLAELHRVLAHDGRLVVHTRAPEARRLMGRLGLGWMARRLRFYDDDQLGGMITAAGFRRVTVRRRPRSYAQLATGHRSE